MLCARLTKENQINRFVRFVTTYYDHFRRTKRIRTKVTFSEIFKITLRRQ